MRGKKYTGSMSWTTGQHTESRWVYCDAAGQETGILTVASSGPAVPTIDNMIITDQPIGKTLGLHIKTTKVAHVDQTQFDGTGGIKRVYAWCGGDESTPCQLQYQGIGSAIPYMVAGSVAAGQHQLEMNPGALMVNNENAAGAIGHTLIWFGVSAEHIWSYGFGFVGFHLQFRPIDGETFTGVNTWDIECEYIYGE